MNGRLIQVLAAVFMALVFTPFWMAFGPVLPRIEYVSGEQQLEARSGGRLAITREYEVRRPVVMTVTRSVESEGCASGKRCVIYSLPSTTRHFGPGRYHNTRIHDLPELPPGKYLLRFHATYDENPLRTVTVPLPLVLLTVTE